MNKEKLFDEFQKRLEEKGKFFSDGEKVLLFFLERKSARCCICNEIFFKSEMVRFKFEEFANRTLYKFICKDCQKKIKK